MKYIVIIDNVFQEFNSQEDVDSIVEELLSRSEYGFGENRIQGTAFWYYEIGFKSDVNTAKCKEVDLHEYMKQVREELEKQAVEAGAMTEKKRFKLGNVLRGYFTGEYHTAQEAWEDLCELFDSGFGEERASPRKVYLSVFEYNQYGIEQFLCCCEGFTPGKYVAKGKQE